MSDGNGVHITPAGEAINIVFTRNPFTVQLVARDVEIHMTIAVLRMALDELEGQLRILRMQQLQQANADLVLAQRIANDKAARR